MDQAEQRALRSVRIQTRGLEIWNQEASIRENAGRHAQLTYYRDLGTESKRVFHQLSNAERIQRDAIKSQNTFKVVAKTGLKQEIWHKDYVYVL